MREVIYFENRWSTTLHRYEKVQAGKGKFHQFGIGYDEFESGPGNFSTAIIEMDDGTIKNIYVEYIQFVS